MPAELLRTVVWRSLAQPGCEYCEFWRLPDGWKLNGTTVGVAPDDTPLAVRYDIMCDRSWRTRRVHLQCAISGVAAVLDLEADERQRWLAGGQEIATVRGCLDADLSVSPATNTLPIRRCELGDEASVDVTAAWIRFPSLEISPLRQRYTRLEGNRYRYESDTGFKTEIEVDELGLVISYGGGWERVPQP